MNSITKETRRESYRLLDSANLYKNIIEVLKTGGSYTAHEVAVILYNKKLIKYPTRQAVAPRLTELVDKGIVEATGKVYDRDSGRKVACYRLVEK